VIAEDGIDPDWLIEWSMATNRGGPNSQYIYNFREDARSETCTSCSDAAHWPTKSGHYRYLRPDTIVMFFNEHGELTGSNYQMLGEAWG